jgi:hypothetical protein
MSTGRTTEARTVTVTKNSTAAITAAAGTFSTKDVGRPITGTGIPASTTLAAVASDVAATLSAAATTSTANAAVIGATEARIVTVSKTSSSAAITGAAGTFVTTKDVGRLITGTGIPAATSLAAVASDTAATLSAAATTSTVNSAVIGSEEPRTVTVTKTINSSTITGAAGTFGAKDVGRPITGTGIAAAVTLTVVASDTAATLSTAATATGADSAVIGSATNIFADSLGNGYLGWSPETEAESVTYTVAAFNAGAVTPAIANTYTAFPQRSRG